MLDSAKTWHVAEILNFTADYLKKNAFENPRLNAERLLAHTLNLNRIDLYLNFDRPLAKPELARFRLSIKRRLTHEPLQYIIGETEFFSLPFLVNPNVLIPRPETEILVEKVIEKCKKNFPNKSEVSILDVGTGSGCIAVALAKHLKNAILTAIDISSAALETAKENARRNKVEDRMEFKQIDFMDENLPLSLPQKFDVIVSNPPYISSAEFDKLPGEVKNFEPPQALKDGKDGLGFYRRLAETFPKVINSHSFLAVEVGLGQAQFVKEIFAQNQFSEIEVYNDLNEIERVVCCKYKQEAYC